MKNRYFGVILLLFVVVTINISNAQVHKKTGKVISKKDLAYLFNNPPEDAKPGVLWMWMGSNVSRE